MVGAGQVTTPPAALYDRLYDALGKDYAAEVRTVLRLARSIGGRRPRSVLDVACGTGRHLAAFPAGCRRVGVDLDEAMLATAARRVPEATLVHADMTELDLGAQFDLVTCLFGSIAYVRTVPRLRQAVRGLAAHVAPGGVLVVEPWYRPETWEADGAGPDLLVVDEPDRKAVRVCRSSRRGALSVLEFDYLVADGARVDRYADRHELRLFETEHYLDAFAAAGLDPTIDEYGLWGHGLVLARAPR